MDETDDQVAANAINTAKCWVGLHDWTAWKAHEPPCNAGPFVVHYVRKCTHCEKRQHRLEDAPATDCGGCPNDPAEYLVCPRWRAEDPACRPKEK